jgi:hypothetical protein
LPFKCVNRVKYAPLFLTSLYGGIGMTTTLTIQTPDDWHLHFRDGEMLKETVPATARCFKRAIVMPNLELKWP